MDTQSLMDAAITFPMKNVLTRYAEEQKLDSGVVELHEQELKRYLILCALYPEGGWPMTATIDELWHTFIIFTREYHEFCHRLGRFYIHHRPDTGGEDMVERGHMHRRFRELYQTHFGTEPPAEIWPTRHVSGGSCSDKEHCSSRDCMVCGHCDDKKSSHPKPPIRPSPPPEHCRSRDCMVCGHCKD